MRPTLRALAFAAVLGCGGGALQAQGAPARPDFDPAGTRLFFTPTGRTLPAHSVVLNDYFGIFPFVSWGVTDRVMVSGGVSLIPAATTQLLYASGSVGLVRTSRWHVAVGGTYTRIAGVKGNGSVIYGSGTWGGENAALTLGAGYPFLNGSSPDTPVWLAGGEARVTRGLKLLGEAWKIPGSEEVPVIFGVRFLGGKLSVDVGWLTLTGAHANGLPLLPWIDFSIRF